MKGIARRYARAAVNAADEQGGGKAVAALSDEIVAFSQAVEATEELRSVLACARQHAPRWVIRRRLHDFYAWCADTNVPEVHTLAATIEAWWPETLLFLKTGLTNGRTEGINRVVKDVGRRACGFRNRLNHRNRVRLICTRRHRRASAVREQHLPG